MEKLNFEQYKADVHRTLLSKLDLEKLAAVQNGRAKQAVLGLGPLEPLLRDPKVSDILVNNKNTVYAEKDGILQKTEIIFRDDRHIMQIIDRIVSQVGRRIDESSADLRSEEHTSEL